MKTLIIHHLQPMWNSGLNNFGTSYWEMLDEVCTHLQENDYDNVIVTNFEAGFDLEDEQQPLREFCYPTVHDYMYGWEFECAEIDEQQKEDIENGKIVEDAFNTSWALGGSHSQIVLIPEWMKDLKNDEVYICGAFDGECIEDLEIALGALDIEPNRIENLIV